MGAGGGVRAYVRARARVYDCVCARARVCVFGVEVNITFLLLLFRDSVQLQHYED